MSGWKRWMRKQLGAMRAHFEERSAISYPKWLGQVRFAKGKQEISPRSLAAAWQACGGLG